MNQDREHLRLLAIFHYIVGGLAALFSFFPLLYTTVGAIFIFVPRHGTPKPGEELPPEFIGWIFAVTGSHSLWPASNASSFLSEQFLGYSQLSSFHANP